MTGSVDGFVVEFDAEGDEVTVCVAGEVDVATASAMAAQLDRAVEGFTGEVTVNLSGVTFLDSTGMYTLVRTHAALMGRSRRLVVAEPAVAATRLFEVAGVLELLLPATDSG
jgi:anti-sigma B factor antagonist